jgi:predicted chitinase
MDYRSAAKIRKKSFSSLLAEQEGGLLSSIGSAISSKTRANVTGIKETFDPMNIAKKMTFGSNWAPAMMGKMTGRKQSDIAHFTGARPSGVGRSAAVQDGDSENKPVNPIIESVKGIERIIKEREKQIAKWNKEDDKENKRENKVEQKRHEQILKALTLKRVPKKVGRPKKIEEPKKPGEPAKPVEKPAQKQQTDKAAKDKADRVAKDKAAKDKADREAKDKSQKEAKDKADKEAKDAKDKADRESKQAKDKADREAKDARDKADREAKQTKDKTDKETATRQKKEEVKKEAEKPKEVKKEPEKVPKKEEVAPPKPSAEKPVTTKPPAQKAPKIPSVSGGKGVVIAALVAAGLSAKAQANVLAQVESESNFVPKNESLFYTTPEGIQNTFNKDRIPTLEFAQQFVSKKGDDRSEKLANYVYAKTDGNSEPGDGWKYRGRGFLQITGKNAYKALGDYLKIDLVSNPDLLNSPEIAAKSIPWFFLNYKSKLTKGDPGRLEDISLVNKAVGFSDPTREKAKARAVLAEKYQKEDLSVQMVPVDSSTGSQIDKSSQQNATMKDELNKDTPTPTNVNNTTVNQSNQMPPSGSTRPDDRPAPVKKADKK